ncbi:hypothetical protein V3C99_008734, partial [Haemonchus contortus]|uniref:RxLR effector protein n=1 Tax=Haemonchus contortus TaxID=6289 RepID=A0A7I4YMU6_HAECO
MRIVLCITPGCNLLHTVPAATTTTTASATTTTTTTPSYVGELPDIKSKDTMTVGKIHEKNKLRDWKKNKKLSRSLIASGRAKNKLGEFAPKAARMMRVGFDAWFSILYKNGVPKDNVFSNEIFTRGSSECNQ